jgi:hypothetical protein
MADLSYWVSASHACYWPISEVPLRAGGVGCSPPPACDLRGERLATNGPASGPNGSPAHASDVPGRLGGVSRRVVAP